jgi:hypothetical protein
VDAVLVEAVGSKASQLAVTRAVLESITSVKLRAYLAQTAHAKGEEFIHVRGPRN